MSGFFITGSDTGVGKTHVSCLLIKQRIAQGERVIGLKPIASGCYMTEQGLRNEDAVALIQASNVKAAYQTVNRYAFAPSIAPHIAAEQVGVGIILDDIFKDYCLANKQADSVIVEGVGGWFVPLGQGNTIQSLAVTLQLPVILVVAMRLGCLNHALLTAQAIEQSGLSFCGWVANQVSRDGTFIDEQIETLQQELKAPLLFRLPFDESNRLKPDREVEL